MSQLFDQIAKETPQYVRKFVDISFDVSDRVQALLTIKGMQQKDLAKALGKQESEVSKWLSGTHNFTLKTLCKISAILDADIIHVSNGLAWESQVQVHLQELRDFLSELNSDSQSSYLSTSAEEAEELIEQLEDSSEATIIPFGLAA